MKFRKMTHLAALGLLFQVAGGLAWADGPSVRSAMGIQLVDVAREAGLTLLNVVGERAKDYIVESNGNGAAFFDFDGAHDLDVLFVNGSTLEHIKQGGDPMVALYRNDESGKFADITASSGMHTKGWGMGVCVADYDNDGLEDVYITVFGPNVLYRNNDDGTFTDITSRAGVGDTRWSTNCAFGDYDRDGCVDLYVANFLSFDEQVIPIRGESSRCK